MAQITVDYQAWRRRTEVWSPIPFTNNLQIWASVSAFGLALFALLYNFLWEWCAMIGISLPNIYGATAYPTWSVAGYIIFGIIAIVGFILFVGGFASLVYLIVQVFKHKLVPVNTENIPDNVKAGMSKGELAKLGHPNMGLVILDTDSLNTFAEQIISVHKIHAEIHDFLIKIEGEQDDESGRKSK